MASNSPVSPTRLKQICNDACDSALVGAESYDHASTESWNNQIINTILKALISESTPASDPPEPQNHKFVVNSTIIQHLTDPRLTGSTQTDDLSVPRQADGSRSEVEESVSMGTDLTKRVGRRGMHSASGAYWNNERDGIWSHKYENAGGKGMDIVITVVWIGV